MECRAFIQNGLVDTLEGIEPIEIDLILPTFYAFYYPLCTFNVPAV